MRQAWLIISHNEFEILQQLISLLDHEQSDFFIHIDAKVQNLPALTVEKGRLFMLDKRVDVRWGGVSQIEAELVLLEYAHQKGPYSHYHILSGTHLPLKPIEELLQFYNGHQSEEVMRFWEADPGDADFKLRRYHFPLQHYKFGRPLRRRLCQLSWQCVIKVQKMLGIRHLKEDTFIKTDNWLSLSETACHYLVSEKNRILRKYKWSFCGDEYFVASELEAKTEEFTLYDCKNLLYVEFQKDTPRSFTLQEYPQLQDTGYFWARKFTASI